MTLVIYGKSVSDKKKIIYALKIIYGISNFRAMYICRDLGFPPEMRIIDLTEEQQLILVKKIKNEYIVESNLIEQIKQNIKVYYNNGSQHGYRLRTGLPTRGQRTHTNGKSARNRLIF